MERGEPKDPAEVKRHTTKREWQVAKQEQELNILEDKKAILEFDLQSIQCRKNYESKKAEEAERKRQDIQNEINKLESTNNELIQKNEELYNNRYEQFKKYKQGMELRKRMETEIEELSKQENNLKEYLIRNSLSLVNFFLLLVSKIFEIRLHYLGNLFLNIRQPDTSKRRVTMSSIFTPASARKCARSACSFNCHPTFCTFN